MKRQILANVTSTYKTVNKIKPHDLISWRQAFYCWIFRDCTVRFLGVLYFFIALYCYTSYKCHYSRNDHQLFSSLEDNLYCSNWTIVVWYWSSGILLVNCPEGSRCRLGSPWITCWRQFSVRLLVDERNRNNKVTGYNLVFETCYLTLPQINKV